MLVAGSVVYMLLRVRGLHHRLMSRGKASSSRVQLDTEMGMLLGGVGVGNSINVCYDMHVFFYCSSP